MNLYYDKFSCLFFEWNDLFLTLFFAMHKINSNTYNQFFITTVRTSWLDGRHVVFGTVLEGKELVKAMEAQGSPGAGKPKTKITIVDSGALETLIVTYT